MSLTSYRAAPPRVIGCGRRSFACAQGNSARSPAPNQSKQKAMINIVTNVHAAVAAYVGLRAFKRPGSDLLSHALRHSTIGAEGLNGRVRNGVGCIPLAITTRPVKRTNPDPDGRSRALPENF